MYMYYNYLHLNCICAIFFFLLIMLCGEVCVCGGGVMHVLLIMKLR